MTKPRRAKYDLADLAKITDSVRGRATTARPATNGSVDPSDPETIKAIKTLLFDDPDILITDQSIAERLGEHERAANETATRTINKLTRELRKAKSDFEDYMNRTIEDIRARELRRLVVKVADQPEVKFDTTHKQFDRVMRKVANGIHVLMSGPSGAGKGHAARQVAEALGRPYYAKSCTIGDTTSAWMGYYDASGRYIPSLFRTAYEHGGVMLLDEWDAANPAISIQINAGLGDGMMGFPDGMVPMHPEFVALAAGNTWGRGADRQYKGTGMQNAATMDRFVKVFWDYDEELELAIASNEDWTRYVQAVRKQVFDNGLLYVVSPRTSIRGSVELAAGAPWAEVAHDHIFADWSRDDLDRASTSLAYDIDVGDGIKARHRQVMEAITKGGGHV